MFGLLGCAFTLGVLPGCYNGYYGYDRFDIDWDSCPFSRDFQCGDGSCFAPRRVCDGVDDCPRGEDEDSYYCGGSNYRGGRHHERNEYHRYRDRDRYSDRDRSHTSNEENVRRAEHNSKVKERATNNDNDKRNRTSRSIGGGVETAVLEKVPLFVVGAAAGAGAESAAAVATTTKSLGAGSAVGIGSLSAPSPSSVQNVNRTRRHMPRGVRSRRRVSSDSGPGKD